MLKIFVLDDDINRQEYLRKWVEEYYGEDDIFMASNRYEAEEILGSEKEFDVLILDHDLGISPCDSKYNWLNNTGYEVAKFIIKNKIKYNECIIVSLNWWGADNMYRILPKSVKIPIIYLSELKTEDIILAFEEEGVKSLIESASLV